MRPAWRSRVKEPNNSIYSAASLEMWNLFGSFMEPFNLLNKIKLPIIEHFKMWCDRCESILPKGLHVVKSIIMILHFHFKNKNRPLKVLGQNLADLAVNEISDAVKCCHMPLAAWVIKCLRCALCLVCTAAHWASVRFILLCLEPVFWVLLRMFYMSLCWSLSDLSTSAIYRWCG